MWKTITGSGPSALPIGDQNEETRSDIETTEQPIPLRHRNKSQIVLARKLRNLQEFANAYNLNLSDNDDRLLTTDNARKNVQRMANDLLASIEETNKLNLGSFVAQMGGSGRRLLTPSRMQTFYQELSDVMPEKWKEIFQQRQEQSV